MGPAPVGAPRSAVAGGPPPGLMARPRLSPGMPPPPAAARGDTAADAATRELLAAVDELERLFPEVAAKQQELRDAAAVSARSLAAEAEKEQAVLRAAADAKTVAADRSGDVTLLIEVAKLLQQAQHVATVSRHAQSTALAAAEDKCEQLQESALIKQADLLTTLARNTTVLHSLHMPLPPAVDAYMASVTGSASKSPSGGEAPAAAKKQLRSEIANLRAQLASFSAAEATKPSPAEVASRATEEATAAISAQLESLRAHMEEQAIQSAETQATIVEVAKVQMMELQVSHPRCCSAKRFEPEISPGSFLQVNAEEERRSFVGQLETRTRELRSMQETFLAQLQAAQREIGMLKQAVLSPVALTASRQDQLVREVDALQAEMESKAQAAVARSHDIVSASEETTRRIVDAARGDSGRLASECLAGTWG